METEVASKEPRPTLIVPYQGPDSSGESQDIFLYLRPESNGVDVEKAIFHVFHNVPQYRSTARLVYLANLPGGFLAKHRVVERHYRVREYFARLGKHGMTEGMRRHFQIFYGIAWEEADIVGAYEAMRRLEIGPEELFQIWVEPYDILITCGQIIKRYGELFIINYDIPRLLDQSLEGTDIAAMIFRFQLGIQEIHECLEEVRQSLVLSGVLDPYKPPARVFHFSKSPFDLLLDSEGYLVGEEGRLLGWRASSFGRYLIEHGLNEAEVDDLLDHPIVQFQVSRVGVIEENIHIATVDFTYAEALEKYRTHVGRIRLNYALLKEAM